MLRGILTFITALVTTVILGTIATVGSLLSHESDICLRLGRLWSRLNMAATGLKPVFRGSENLSSSLPCIFLANHQSTMDIWLMLMILPESARFIAKESLFRVPILGWALTSAGFISIDRSSRTRALKSLDAAAAKIRSGKSVVMFPEGTRSRSGKLAKFKKGAFHLALKSGVPVVPVSLRGTFEAMPPGLYRISKVPVEVTVHPPIDVTAFLPDNTKDLMVAVRDAIASGLGPETVERPASTGTTGR